MSSPFFSKFSHINAVEQSQLDLPDQIQLLAQVPVASQSLVSSRVGSLRIDSGRQKCSITATAVHHRTAQTLQPSHILRLVNKLRRVDRGRIMPGDHAHVDLGRDSWMLHLQNTAVSRRGRVCALQLVVLLRLAVLGLDGVVDPAGLDHVDLPQAGVLVLGALGLVRDQVGCGAADEVAAVRAALRFD